LGKKVFMPEKGEGKEFQLLNTGETKKGAPRGCLWVWGEVKTTSFIKTSRAYSRTRNVIPFVRHLTAPDLGAENRPEKKKTNNSSPTSESLLLKGAYKKHN